MLEGLDTNINLPLCCNFGINVTSYNQVVFSSSIKHTHSPDGIKELVFDSKVDLVVVLVKAPLHRIPILAAIGAGKDMFAEWPVAMSLEQMEEIEKLRKSSNSLGLLPPMWDDRQSSIKFIVPWKLQYWGPVVMENRVYIHKPNSGISLLEIMVQVGHQLNMFMHILGDFKSVSAMLVTMYPTATVLPSLLPKNDKVPQTLQVVGWLEYVKKWRGEVKKGKGKFVRIAEAVKNRK
ncbi:hypothetical protein BDN71DRAFT_1428056 [Pleurotus eryngii]|uniref:Uncharacterized protein n=1 Tax=Pleurotus eryngii TaxID=5323 RepID=A0A9P6A5E7_PLEER|nr:hypothetical protein BDN71DRAFT_1428056 [Pleurotus eryngii]